MPDTAPQPRVLLTKSFIDSHDRAIATIALALRDAAMEVVLIDYEQPEDVVTVALQEDVDAVGLSILSGAHLALTPRVLELMLANGQGDVPVFVGGIIPEDDAATLRELGVAAVFGPGTPMADVVDAVRAAAGRVGAG